MPLWVRIWCRTPLIHRFAREWMWHHGGFLVYPPEHPFSIAGMPQMPPDDTSQE